MVTIEGIWKKGEVISLNPIEVADGTRVTIIIPEKKKITSLAGIWKDYKTKEGRSLDDLKKEIYDSKTTLIR
jgi:hypothetical protein